MGLLNETLPNLSLASPGLDRHAERRSEPGLVAELLADTATRVLVVRGDKVPVVITTEPEVLLSSDPATAATATAHGPTALALRPPQ